MFSIESLQNVVHSLQTLTCQDSNVYEIVTFQLLQRVTHVDLRNNKIGDFDVSQALLSCSI